MIIIGKLNLYSLNYANVNKFNNKKISIIIKNYGNNKPLIFGNSLPFFIWTLFHLLVSSRFLFSEILIVIFFLGLFSINILKAISNCK